MQHSCSLSDVSGRQRLQRVWGSVCAGTARKAPALRAPSSQLFLTSRALPESARWLLTRGRVEEAKRVIQKAASVNKRKLSPALLSQVLPAGWACPAPRLTHTDVSAGPSLHVFLPAGPREDRPLRECPGSVQAPPAPEGDPDSLLCLVSALGSMPLPGARAKGRHCPGMCPGMWDGGCLAGMGCVGTTGSLSGCATVFSFDF